MECFPSCHRCFLRPSKSTGWCYRLCNGSSGEICHLPLRPVTSVTSMRHGSIYIARKPGTLKTSLLPKQRSFSIHYEPCTRLVTSGARHLCHLRYYQIHQTGDKSRRKGYGSQTGCDCMCVTYTMWLQEVMPHTMQICKGRVNMQRFMPMCVCVCNRWSLGMDK